MSLFLYSPKVAPASNIDSIVQNIPLSFIRSGDYNWNAGNLAARRSYGNSWSSRVYFGTNSRYLTFHGTAVNTRYNNAKGYGFVVHCVE